MSNTSLHFAHILIRYERLSHRMALFLLDEDQELIRRAIRNYSIELHRLNLKYKTLPIEVKELNQCALIILEKADCPFIIKYFKAQMEGLTYA